MSETDSRKEPGALATRRPLLVILVAVLCCIVLAVPALGLEVEPDGRRLLDDAHPVRVEDREVARHFGIGDAILVFISSEEEAGEVDRPSFAVFLQATRFAKAASEVEGLPLERQVSPLGLEPGENSEVKVGLETLGTSDLFRGSIVSEDGHAIGLMLGMTPHADRAQVIERIRELVREYDDMPGIRAVVAGAPIAETALTTHILRDLATTMPAVAVLVFLLLLLGLGSLTATLVALLEVMLSVGATAGVMALSGVPIYLPTAVIPVVLIAVGVCDEIHVYAAFRRHRKRDPDGDPGRAMNKALHELRRPILITSLTTALAFFSFAVGDVEAIRAVGIFAGFGVLFTMVLSLTLAPAAWTSLERLLAGKERGILSRMDTKLRPDTGTLPTQKLAWQHARWRVFLCVAVAGLAAFQLRSLSLQDDWIGNFEQTSDYVAADSEINRRFGGTHRLLVQLKGSSDGYWHEPDHLQRLRVFQDRVAELEQVGKTLSAASFIPEIERLSGRQKALPASVNGVKRALNALGTPAGDAFARTLLDEAGERTLVHVLLKNADYQRIDDVISTVERHTREVWPDGNVSARITGDAKVSHSVVASVVGHQIGSLVGALAIVLLCGVAGFRSVKVAVLAAAPVTLTALVILGAMATLGIPLGIATSMVSGIGIGVGIDYALHLVSQWQANSGSAVERVQKALRASGPAITINALVVGLGLLALLVAATPPLRMLGGLACAALLTSFALTIWILPPLLLRFGDAKDSRS